MNQGLLVWERMVLESLGQKEKAMQELSQDTSISQPLLKNIINDLVRRDILDEKLGIYKVKGELSFVNELVQEEVKDVFTSLVGLYFKNKSQIKLKKIFLTPAEFDIFQMQLYSLEGFIEKISKEKREIRLCEQRVVVWGHAPYAHLLEEI